MTSSLSILLKSCSTASFHFLDLFCAVIKGYYRDSTEETKVPGVMWRHLYQ